MNKLFAIVAGLILVVLLVLFFSTYTVSFHQVAIKTTFGQTGEGSVITEPGLKFKLPVADRVTKLDTRLQLLHPNPETVPTADGQQVVVEAFMMWKVDTEGDGPLRFFKEMKSTVEARRALNDQFLTVMRQQLARYPFDELIGPDNRLAAAEADILRVMGERTVATGNGVKPQKVGLSRLQLPSKTSRAVLTRMETTRKRLSEGARNEGNAQAKSIQADAKSKADKIIAFAEQRAAVIRAKGEEEAARHLAEMSEEEDFAIFLAWLDTVEASLGELTTLVLETNMPPFHLMDMNAARSPQGIPMPAVDPIRPAAVPAAAAPAPIDTPEPAAAGEGS